MVFVVFEVVLVVVEQRGAWKAGATTSDKDNNVKALANINLISKLRCRLHTLILLRVNNPARSILVEQEKLVPGKSCFNKLFIIKMLGTIGNRTAACIFIERYCGIII